MRRTGLALFLSCTASLAAPELTSPQAQALSRAYPESRIVARCAGRFSGADREELVLGIRKDGVHRVALLWREGRWTVHVVDDELGKDGEPRRWSEKLGMKCGIDGEFDDDSDLTYALGDRPLFELAEKKLARNKVVCFATDDVYNNWDCVVYSPADGRFRLWYRQEHAD